MIAFDKQFQQYTQDPGVELMLRLQAGDLDALDELADRYSRRISCLAHEILGYDYPVEDIQQEVLMRVFRTRESYVPTAKFSTWLSSIARNYLLNVKRDRAKKRTVCVGFAQDQEFNEAETSASPLFQMDDQLAKIITAEELQQVRDAVQKLSPRYRSVINLVYFQSLSYERVASELQISKLAVKAILVRARRRLLADLHSSVKP